MPRFVAGLLQSTFRINLVPPMHGARSRRRKSETSRWAHWRGRISPFVRPDADGIRGPPGSDEGETRIFPAQGLAREHSRACSSLHWSSRTRDDASVPVLRIPNLGLEVACAANASGCLLRERAKLNAE